jgi:hypothetical protein
MPGEEICTIINAHVEDCGQPPQFDIDDFAYVSYFENVHGEQSIFLYDSENNEIVVYLADAGWDNPQVIPDRVLVESTSISKGTDIGIMPDSSEKLWLKACKSAVKPQIEYILREEEGM